MITGEETAPSAHRLYIKVSPTDKVNICERLSYEFFMCLHTREQ
jgi:hypothetical protein